MNMIIDDIWQSLEQDESGVSSGYLTRRILPNINYDIFLVIEKPSNTRLLFFRFKSTLLDRKMIYPSSRSFVMNRIALQQDSEEYATLQLVLTNPRHKDIFTTLVQDIVDSLTLISEERAAVSEFITRVKRWQTFLEKNNPEGLSEIAQQGLYGELWFLRQVVFPNLESVKGLRCWTGPKATQQDFQFSGCAVEVKTTSSKQHQTLLIASERQLDDTGIGTIILLHLSLDVRQGQGETLPEIVASVRSLIANNAIAKDELENLLFEVGYLDSQTSRYEDISYTIRESNYFKVREDFPRIIESDLRNGIGDVRYTISVAECKRFSINESEVISLIRGQS
jgi:Putative  PD-(D/E)XK family member, (DUF4420)